MSGCLSSPFLRRPSPHRWLLTGPTPSRHLGARSKTAPASPLLPLRHCHGFSFRWVLLMRFRARLGVSPISEASSKRQGDGQRFQKKAMKTTNQNEASAPANVRPSSVSKTSKAQPDFVRHCTNRRLSTETVLNYLRTRLPRQYEVAEVVGKWVWLDVSPTRKPNLAALLWALGFHWNQRRGVWQHPCGSFNPFGIHPADPRAKYRSYFPADVLPA